jgi:hypothetical protein
MKVWKEYRESNLLNERKKKFKVEKRIMKKKRRCGKKVRS